MLSTEVRRLESENAALKEAVEAMKKQFGEDQVKPKACELCQYYLQHYVYTEGRYTKTHCGHCTHGRVKDRKPDDTCKYFEVGTYDTKRFM